MWLSLMRERVSSLPAADDDGSIWITIDDNERTT